MKIAANLSLLFTELPLQALRTAGYDGWLGAECRPDAQAPWPGWVGWRSGIVIDPANS